MGDHRRVIIVIGHAVQLRGLAADDFRKHVPPRNTATTQGLRDTRHAPQHSAVVTPLIVAILPPP